MRPVTVCLEMAATLSRSSPMLMQPEIEGWRQPYWQMLSDVIQAHVGHVPVYVMSANRQGAVGGWDQGKAQEPLRWEDLQHLTENKALKRDLAGVLTGSTAVLIVGNQPFEHLFKSLVSDLPCQISNVYRTEHDLQTFGRHLTEMTREGGFEKVQRLQAEIDYIDARYDGRVPDGDRAHQRRLREEISRLIGDNDSEGA